jgi:hypothetical protein
LNSCILVGDLLGICFDFFNNFLAAMKTNPKLETEQTEKAIATLRQQTIAARQALR